MRGKPRKRKPTTIPASSPSFPKKRSTSLPVKAKKTTPQQAILKTNYGEFKAHEYRPAWKNNGAQMILHFIPNKKVNATNIAMVQIVKTQLMGSPVATHPTLKNRMVSKGPGLGFRIDQGRTNPNPIYAAQNGKQKQSPLAQATINRYAVDQFGYHYKKGKQTKHQVAKLSDTPRIPNSGKGSGQLFETTALAVAGVQKNTYMGAVSWGWKKDKAAKLTLLPLKLVSKGKPSKRFTAAAKKWNTSKTTGTLETINKPTKIYAGDHMKPKYTLKPKTVVKTYSRSFTHFNGKAFITIRPNKKVPGFYYKIGYMKVTDLRDQGNGKSTIKLPI